MGRRRRVTHSLPTSDSGARRRLPILAGMPMALASPRRAWAPLCAGLLLSLLAVAARAEPPVVVELFTSQGCSSCPPADAYLGELTQRDNVIALSFHVDYWDYIGWRDRFADPQNSARQQAYAERFKRRYVYTPQIVVNGAAETTGSAREQVDDMIADALTDMRVPVRMVVRGTDRISAEVDAASFAGSADLWFVRYDAAQETAVASGENAGRRLRNYNVVRELRRLGEWHGEALSVDLPVTDDAMGPGAGCAVILQAADMGTILGAAALRPGS